MAQFCPERKRFPGVEYVRRVALLAEMRVRAPLSPGIVGSGSSSSTFLAFIRVFGVDEAADSGVFSWPDRLRKVPCSIDEEVQLATHRTGRRRPESC